jgi:hypothetical protein
MADLISTINRYQGVSGDSKPATALAGSTFYEVDTGDWFVWDGDSWEAYTFPLLDATSPELPTTDEKAALNGAASPSAGVPVVANPATAQSITDALIALGLVTQAP